MSNNNRLLGKNLRILLILVLGFISFVSGAKNGKKKKLLPHERRMAIPLNSSVMMMNEWGLQSAPDQVARAAKCGNRRVNFVVTLHCKLDRNLRVLNYGLIRSRKGWYYTPFDKDLRKKFKDYLIAAFAKAEKLGLKIAILPHLDAAGPQLGWRNRYDMDPLAVCGGFSYFEIMIKTIIEALEETVSESTEVDLALTGEMGKTIFAYPDSYLKILKELREKANLKRLKIGPSINFNEVTGKHHLTPETKELVQKLMEESDFLGIACYRPVWVPPVPENFTQALDAEDGFIAKMKAEGIKLPKDLEIHYSEIGLGGGGLNEEWISIGMAKTPEEAARAPWAGTSDPKKTPWKTKEMIKFRRDYYRALTEFLRTQPASHYVTAAYLWNAGSWDAQGIDKPDFVDKEIIEIIRKHNIKTWPENRRNPRNSRAKRR